MEIFLTETSKGVLKVYDNDRKHHGITVVYRRRLPCAAEKFDGIPEVVGAYLLVDTNFDTSGTWNIYAGRSAEKGLRERVKQHIKAPKPEIKNWNIAVLVHSHDLDVEFPFEISSMLEHMLYDLITNSGVKVANKNVPQGNPKLALDDIKKVDKQILEVTALLKCLGLPVTSNLTDRKEPAKKKQAKKQKVKANNKPSLPALIESGLVNIGDILIPASPKYANTGKIEVANKTGQLLVVEYHGSDVRYKNLTFTSLSATGEHFTGCATNGWTFWKHHRTSKIMSDIQTSYLSNPK